MMTEKLPWGDDVAYSGVVGGSIDRTVDTPIVFVHGNGRDATDWAKHFSYFTENGVNPSRLWAISFDNSDMTHDSLATQLEDFMSKLFDTVDATQISFIGHSLGVTVGRVWMVQYDRYENVKQFVGIAGANHGLNTCGLYKISEQLPSSNRFKPCQMLGSSIFYTPPIEKLNEEVGETLGETTYYTIRGANDNFFTGCIDSPKLEGAEENVLLEADHEEVRESDESIKLIFGWIIGDER